MAKEKKKVPGRPKTRLTRPDRAAAQRTKEGEEKYIIIARTDQIQDMKNIAYWERLTIKEAFARAMQAYKKSFEEIHGPLKQREAS